MTKPPDDITYMTVRDESGDLRQRVKQGARRKGQKVADFLYRVIADALEDTETSFVAESDRKSGQNESRGCCPEQHN